MKYHFIDALIQLTYSFRIFKDQVKIAGMNFGESMVVLVTNFFSSSSTFWHLHWELIKLFLEQQRHFVVLNVLHL